MLDRRSAIDPTNLIRGIDSDYRVSWAQRATAAPSARTCRSGERPWIRAASHGWPGPRVSRVSTGSERAGAALNAKQLIRSWSGQVSCWVRRRNALAMTDTLDRAMAAAAMMGESRSPKVGYRTPAAIGIPAAL